MYWRHWGRSRFRLASPTRCTWTVRRLSLHVLNAATNANPRRKVGWRAAYGACKAAQDRRIGNPTTRATHHAADGCSTIHAAAAVRRVNGAVESSCRRRVRGRKTTATERHRTSKTADEHTRSHHASRSLSAYVRLFNYPVSPGGHQRIIERM